MSAIGGCLGNHWEVWTSRGADPWVVEVLWFGYRLPFRVLPTLISGSHSTPQLFPHLHPGDSFDNCDSRSLCEGGSRTSPLGSRVLQSPICYPESHWGLAAGNRSLLPQPFGPRFQFSHGDFRFGSPVSSSGGLDGVLGSPGRLPSGSGASVIVPLLAVLRGVFGSPVSRAVLRPFVSPAGLHAGHGPGLCHHAPLRVPHPAVPGRLARPRLLVSRGCAGEGLPSLALSGARDLGESLQELPRSFPDFRLSGDEFSNSSFEGFPDSKASSEALLSAARVCVVSAAASRLMATTSGGNVVSFLHRAGFSAPDAVPPAPPQHRWPSPSSLRVGVLGRLLPRGSSVVVLRRVPPHCGSPVGSSFSRSSLVNGRLGFRLGCLSSDRPSIRLVVSELFVFFDQPSGTPCGTLRSSGFPAGSSGSLRVPLCGQHHRSLISPEARRHPLDDS